MNADPDEVEGLMVQGAEMRVGRKLKRTLYLRLTRPDDPNSDLCVGIVDSEVLAAEIVRRWNRDCDDDTRWGD